MLIRSLVLYTNKLDIQYEFYIGKLGFELIEKWNEAFSFRAGITRISFLFDDKHKINPSHFAFGIQGCEISKVLKFMDGLVEPFQLVTQETPIVDFPNWKAKSIYFTDPDSNIVEFILREKDVYSNFESFGMENIKSVCEVGIPCDDPNELAESISTETKIKSYLGADSNFIPMGDTDGLLILVKAGKKKWFPTETIANKSRVKVTIQNRGCIADIICENEHVTIE